MTKKEKLRDTVEKMFEPTEEAKAAIDMLGVMIEAQKKNVQAVVDSMADEEEDVERVLECLRSMMREEMFLAWLGERKRRLEFPGAQAFSNGNPFGSSSAF